MTDDIIGLIDGAIEDWTTSADAMRWRPPGAEEPAPPTPPRVLFVINGVNEPRPAITAADLEAMGERLREIGRAYTEMLTRAWEAAAPALARIAQAAGELTENLERARGRGPATRKAASPRVPAYRDERPRWQTPYGPRGRR
ncbi:hypothetical protein BBK14_01900 [Parafrankia soli]|uniref:Uncharacterized protein n=1 Tax=Parafrankia soli TaxID=2599596 RepID=A0A1S1RMJ7_9ACTN|nr:hypothetical protein [Parafrankia soli]OHV46625.1 hypothetical protein BBK14_01900 [Parafrankia soli]